MRVQEAVPRTQPTLRTASKQSPVLLLKISRGQTRFPNRPVLTERYLIGAAPSCDLCLTGTGIPPLHSVIVKEGRSFRWEAMMSRPAVLHNGRATESFTVENGDRVAIGGVQFDVLVGPLSEIADELGLDPAAAVGGPVHEPAELDDLSDLPAPQLVDRLERDLEWIDRFDGRRLLGAGTLLSAVRQRISTPADAEALPPREARLIERLERLAGQLAQCTSALEKRMDEIALDHRALSATLSDVLDAEARLADRLESLLRGIAETAKEPNRTAA